jgi:hypothetical protein
MGNLSPTMWMMPSAIYVAKEFESLRGLQHLHNTITASAKAKIPARHDLSECG